MIQNKKLKRNATSAIAEVAVVALCASNSALPTSVFNQRKLWYFLWWSSCLIHSFCNKNQKILCWGWLLLIFCQNSASFFKFWEHNLATIFVKLHALSPWVTTFLQLLQYHKIAKVKTRACFELNNCQKFLHLPAQCATAIYNLGVTLLANTEKLLKFYRFESEKNIVSFFI